jgi:hypothetical protein
MDLLGSACFWYALAADWLEECYVGNRAISRLFLSLDFIEGGTAYYAKGF